MRAPQNIRGVAGSSVDTPIDLISDEEVEVVETQIRVAPRLRAGRAEQQPVRTHRTRNVARAQAAIETADRTRSNSQAEMNGDRGSQAYAHAEASNTMVPYNILDLTAQPPRQEFVLARHRRSDGVVFNEATSASSVPLSSPAEASSTRTPTPNIDIEQVDNAGPTYFDTVNSQASEPSRLNHFSRGLLHTHAGKHSEATAPPHAIQHEAPKQVSVIGRHQDASSYVAETPLLPYEYTLSRDFLHGNRCLERNAVASPLASQKPPPTSATIVRRDNSAKSAAQDCVMEPLTHLLYTSMDRDDGPATPPVLPRKFIARQYGDIFYEENNSMSSLEEHAVRPSVQVSKEMVHTHESTNWAARWGRPGRDIKGKPLSMSHAQHKHSPDLWSWQSTDEASVTLTKDGMPPPVPTRRGRPAEADPELPLTLWRQPVIEHDASSRQEQNVVSPCIGPPQSSVDTSYAQRVVDSILPHDRDRNRARGSDATHNRWVALSNTGMDRMSSLRAKNQSEYDPGVQMITNGHRNLKFWKQQAAKELNIGPEQNLVSAAVALFDSRSIQTVVPNRYLRTGTSKKKHQWTSHFPGTIEMQLGSPITALKNAYKEHTVDMLDVSRLVLWTDASASGGHHSNQRRGFAVTWRRSTATGWGRWEAVGYQAQGEVLGSDDMETLAVMKAVTKACDLAREMPGQLKAVAIYTDSRNTLRRVRRTNHPLGHHIVRKARTLTSLGPTLSLHWCPGHSGIPGNELADRIAGMARRHVYGQTAEFVDLSDDEDDGWEDI